MGGSDSSDLFRGEISRLYNGDPWEAYFEANVNNHNIKKNTTIRSTFYIEEIWVMLGFSSLLRDGSDSHRFSNRQWTIAMYPVWKLNIRVAARYTGKIQMLLKSP